MQRGSVCGLALLCALCCRAALADGLARPPLLAALPQADGVVWPPPAVPGLNAPAAPASFTFEQATPTPAAASPSTRLSEPLVATNLEALQTSAEASSSAGGFTDFGSAPRGGWDGGVSAYFLTPHWTGGNAAWITSNFLGSIFLQQNFPAPLSATPALWLGYTTASGYGVQTNFFDYSQSWSATTVAPVGRVLVDPYSNANALPGETFTAGSALSLAYWDLELTKRVQAWNWTWTGTAGLRYLRLNEGYHSEAFMSSASHHVFNGWGPTISLAGRRPIGTSGLGFYGSGRGALVFGSQNYFTDLFDGSGDTIHLESRNLGIIPTLQLEFGVDYRRPAFGGRSSWLVETGMVGQAYFSAGTPSAISPVQTMGPIVVSTSSLDATLGLFGFRSSAGLTF